MVAMEPWRLRQPSAPVAPPRPRAGRAPRATPRDPHPIRCRACGHPVTSEEARLEVEGAHVLRRTNPYGITFEFGCFAGAPGAHAVGPPTLEDTWFPGHAWRLAACAACGTHLGWSFEGPRGRFWALILERLLTEPRP